MRIEWQGAEKALPHFLFDLAFFAGECSVAQDSVGPPFGAALLLRNRGLHTIDGSESLVKGTFVFHAIAAKPRVDFVLFPGPGGRAGRFVVELVRVVFKITLAAVQGPFRFDDALH